MAAIAEQVSIAHATREDVHEILAMIKELADYENESSKVLATDDSLVRTLTFAPSVQHTNSGYAKTLLLRLPIKLAKEDEKAGFKAGAVAGMAMYFNNYSTWRSRPGIYLEDLYVRPQYRKRGYGKMLIQALAQEVLMIDGGRLEWSCLKWNTPSLEFYKSLGAVRMDDWVQLRVDGDALEKLARGNPEPVQQDTGSGQSTDTATTQ